MHWMEILEWSGEYWNGELSLLHQYLLNLPIFPPTTFLYYTTFASESTYVYTYVRSYKPPVT